MISNPSDDPQTPRRPGRFQFRLSTLFVLMFAVSVLSAAMAGLVRQGGGDSAVPEEFYLAMLTAAPLGAMIVLSLFYAVQNWWGRRPPPDHPDGPPPG